MSKKRFILPTTIGTKAKKDSKTPEGCGLVVYKGQSLREAVEEMEKAAEKVVKKPEPKKPAPAKKPAPKAE